MKYHFSHSIKAIALTILASGLFVGVAYAANYMGSGYFPTNNLNRCHIGSYYSSEAQYASGTWSAATDVSMYYNCSGTHIWTSGMDYGATGWTGYAYICATNGQCDNSSAWNNTYRDCTARLNQYYLRNNSSDSIKSVALHEMGHCYSLGHRTDGGIMDNPPPVLTYPDQTSIDLVNARY